MSKVGELLLEQQNNRDWQLDAKYWAMKAEEKSKQFSETWSEFQAKNPDADYGEWKFGPNFCDWDE